MVNNIFNYFYNPCIFNKDNNKLIKNNHYTNLLFKKKNIENFLLNKNEKNIFKVIY